MFTDRERMAASHCGRRLAPGLAGSALTALALAALLSGAVPQPPFGLAVMTVAGAKVTVASIPLDTPDLRISLVTPPGGAGNQATLEQMGRTLPYAAVAVPAAFFSTRNLRPVGNLIVDFHVLNQAPLRQRGTTLAFDTGNWARIVRGLGLKLAYQVNDGQAYWERPAYNALHGLNSPLPPLGDSLKGFNRYYDDRVVRLGRAKAALIEGSRVSRLVQGGSVTIPPYGFVLAGQGRSAEKINRLKVGDWIHLEPATDPPFLGRIRTAVGAGPTVLRQGQVEADWASEGFRDPALRRPTQRVVIGLVDPAMLKVMIIHSPSDLAKAGQIAKSLGCRDAINLDGGTSTGLWAYGKAVVPAGRPLTNLLSFSVPGFKTGSE